MRPGKLATIFAAWTFALATTSSAQNRQQPRSSTQTTRATPRSTVAPRPDSYAPAGTEFTVILNDEVGSASSIPGQRFTGQLERPIRAADGSIFAGAGATVRGKVVRTNYATRPSLRLDFETVETANGAAVLESTVRDADGYAVVAHSDVTGAEGAPDTTFYPAPARTPTAVGGGPRSPDTRPTSAFPTVVLPRGTPIRMTLIHPLLAPDFSAQYGE